ncbi:MAG: tetratricopeptide repeat protein [Bacteroidota bacterium]|nr:tetratricopeptide repeat protein [Bacteroidota bacterium]
MRYLRSPLVLLIVFFLPVFWLGGCGSDGPAARTEPASYGPSYVGWTDEAEYVGIEACQSCHALQYDDFIRSQMGRSWRHARLDQSDASWDAVEPLYSEYDDFWYQPYTQDGNLYVKEYRLEGRDTTHVRIEQIDFIVGSGQHTNSHIYEENGYLYQIPVTWYAQDAKWGLAPKFQKTGNNYRFGRVITDECMACHNGQPTFVPGSENRFEHVPLGINCEKCHGPGSVHVAEKQEGIIIDITKEIDYSIVNPGKLSPEREMDVCQRCHMQGASVFEGGDNPLDWRPGQPLVAHQNVFFPRQADSLTHFIMASHPNRLAQSACFKDSWSEESKAEPMTCLTCHDPHKPIEETREVVNASCQNCHTGKPEDVSALMCSEPTVVSGTNTATCASCHMPQSGSTDIPNIRITDHYIRVPERLSPQEVEDQTRFIRMAAFMDHTPPLRQRADGFLTYYEQFTDRPGMLDSAEVYLRRAQELADAGVEQDGMEADRLIQSWIRLWHLAEDHAAIRRVAQQSGFDPPADAWTYYRIGESFAAINDFNRAIRWYEQALALGPDHLRFMDKLGVAFTQANRFEEASTIFDRLTSANPKYEAGWNNRGFLHLLIGDLEGAEADFRAALALDPNLEQAQANLASILINTGREQEARPILDELIKRHPGNADYRQALEYVRAQVGD